MHPTTEGLNKGAMPPWKSPESEEALIDQLA